MKRLLLSALALGLLGCAPKEVNYAVNIVTDNCDPSSKPFEGVQFLRVRVTGMEPDGGVMEPKTEISSANPATRELKIPEIPAGLGRAVEVRAYDGDPNAGARVLSMGKSLPFDVPDVVPDSLMGGSIKVNVILRKVNSFSPIVSAAAPTQCQQLRVPRAGHTATVLKNGKVFIAGGYNLRPGSPEKRALADTEVFNPGTGAFELTKSLSITSQGAVYELPRAFHASIRLPSGQVMVWGGEVYSNGTNNTVSPIASIIFYDGDVDDFGAVGPRVPAAITRSRHQMAIDANGKVLVVGGITRKSSIVPVDEVEWLDPAAPTNLYKIVDGVTLPRLDATVMPVKKGEFIAVVGGTDGATVKNDISFFKFNGTTFARQSTSMPPMLAGGGRRGAAGALIRDSADLVIMGGYSDPTRVVPVASSEVLNAAAAMVGPGPDIRTARGDVCAATMGDGTVLATGGRTSDSGQPPRSDSTAVLITAANTGGVTSIGAPNLPKARYAHTCTTMLDGTVLVTGGINELTDGSIEILQDAYIYTPIPPAD